ncbi:MAG: serine/threonine-protein kinase [Polyangiales bacterium]
MTLSPGAQVGEYIVLHFIGAGGFGEVFEAREKSTQHRVALKLLLNAGAGTDPEKFKREALYANRVRERSKFVPTVVAAGIDANTKRPWLAVDFIDGQALEAMMEQRQRSGQRFSWGEAKEILFCVMDALRAAHANNIVHCDIKPANIIVARSPTPERQWVAYVLDFGIARLRSDYAARAMTTLAMSPKWASPEQLHAQPVTPKSDLWSFAQVVYWLLVGAQFPVSEAQRTTPAQWGRAQGAALPPLFEEWFARATRNAPEERFESIEQAWSALERTFSDELASQRTIAQPANAYANTAHAPMPPAAMALASQPSISAPALAANAPRTAEKSASKAGVVIAAAVSIVAVVSVGAVVTLRGKDESDRRTTQAPSEVPIRTTVDTSYVPIAQRPDVLEAAQRWSAFVQSYGATPVERVYLPRVRLRTVSASSTREEAQRWWSDWPSHTQTFTVDLSSATVGERPVSVNDGRDARQCEGYSSLVEMRVSVREQKPMLSEQERREMPCTDLRGTYTVRFVRSNGELLVCHENWREADLRAACPSAR